MPDRLTCYDVADYFLSIVDKESRTAISNFKLQKLVYYAQGYNLALFGERLFEEQMEAQENGPVIPALLEKYLPYKSSPIDRPATIDFSKYSENIKELLETVFKEYGSFSPGQLRDMTHEEMPWINGSKSVSKIISDEDLKQYFKSQITNNQITNRGKPNK